MDTFDQSYKIVTQILDVYAEKQSASISLFHFTPTQAR